jgi:hypothetical protein
VGGTTGIYRSLVMLCFGIIGAGILRVLSQLDNTTQIAIDMKTAFPALVVRVDSTERELERIRSAIWRKDHP